MLQALDCSDALSARESAQRQSGSRNCAGRRQQTRVSPYFFSRPSAAEPAVQRTRRSTSSDEEPQRQIRRPGPEGGWRCAARLSKSSDFPSHNDTQADAEQGADSAERRDWRWARPRVVPDSLLLCGLGHGPADRPSTLGPDSPPERASRCHRDFQRLVTERAYGLGRDKLGRSMAADSGFTLDVLRSELANHFDDICPHTVADLLEAADPSIRVPSQPDGFYEPIVSTAGEHTLTDAITRLVHRDDSRSAAIGRVLEGGQRHSHPGTDCHYGSPRAFGKSQQDWLRQLTERTYLLREDGGPDRYVPSSGAQTLSVLSSEMSNHFSGICPHTAAELLREADPRIRIPSQPDGADQPITSTGDRQSLIDTFVGLIHDDEFRSAAMDRVMQRRQQQSSRNQPGNHMPHRSSRRFPSSRHDCRQSGRAQPRCAAQSHPASQQSARSTLPRCSRHAEERDYWGSPHQGGPMVSVY